MTALQIDFLLAGYRHPTTDEVLTGGKVLTYLDGTSTLSALWTDRDKGGAATNPIILDSSGKAEVYGDNIYKMEIYDSGDVLIETIPGLQYKAKIATTKNLGSDYDCDLPTALADIGTVTQTTLEVECACIIEDGTSATVTDNIFLNIKNGGSFDGESGGGTETLNINGPLEAGNYQIFGENLTVTGLKTSNITWFGAVADSGTSDDIEEIQAAADSLVENGTLIIPKGTGYYTISDTIDIDQVDGVTVDFEGGAEIRLTVSGKHGFDISKDRVSVINGTMEGEGTFVTDASTKFALIFSSGDHTLIEGNYLKEPETAGITVRGDYPTVKGNTIEGGPYFADSTAIGSDRHHQGIHIYYGGSGDPSTVLNPTVINNTIQPNTNANPGHVIEGIFGSNQAYEIFGGVITGNKILAVWDHCLYVIAEGTTISNNVCQGGGLKVDMTYTGTPVRGNTITGNTVDVNGVGTPLNGDSGIILGDANYTTISGNTVSRAQDNGIVFTADVDGNKTVSNNVVTGNTINNVVDGGGDDAIGISIDDADLEIFENNTISGNTISNIGDDTDGITAAIAVQIADTATHKNNSFDNNVIHTCQEFGIYLEHLNGGSISGNKIYNTGVGDPRAAIFNTDVRDMIISDNYIEGVGSQMTYGYTEDDTLSRRNRLINNTIKTYATGLYEPDMSSTVTIKGTSNGLGDYTTYSTADNNAMITDLSKLTYRQIFRDPNGASRADVTPTATQMIDIFLPAIGSNHTVEYFNTGEVAEVITITAGANVVVFNNEGASTANIVGGAMGVLRFVRVSSTIVNVYVTVFEAV